MKKTLEQQLLESLAVNLNIFLEDWNKVNHHDHTNGLSQKAVNAYRREHPGSKLKTAVTTKPSKLKAGSKAAKRRKSFCARMSGNKGPMKKPNGKPTPKALALRRWNCESIEEMAYMIARGEQMIAEMKQGVAETTGDEKFDTMMKKVAKTPTQAQRNAERIRQKKEREEETSKHFANGSGFGPNPADKLSIRKGSVAAVDIGKEWMSDTELDQYVPDRLQQQWRELLGYDMNGNPSAYWANLTGGYEPDVNDPQHRRLMVKVANKWFTAKKIPNVKFFDVKDADDELEWLVQIGEQGLAEGSVHGYNVMKVNEKHDQIKITKWLRKEAGLDKNAPLYFDDADLVWGDKTIVPNALVNPKLKMNDLLTAVVHASGQGQAKTDQGGYYREQSVAEGQEFVPEIGDEILWRPKNAKMIPTPVTVLATAPGKLKIKVHSQGMIQRGTKEIFVIDLANNEIFPKPNRPLHKMEDVEEEPSPRHRVSVEIKNPETLRNIHKVIRVHADNKEDALKKVKAHYANKDIYVANMKYLGVVDQGVAEGGGTQQAAIAIAKKKSGNYTKTGQCKK
jgi:hypothetical protein